eukprot:2713602-Pleurochrysis_carterae.AAC.1
MFESKNCGILRFDCEANSRAMKRSARRRAKRMPPCTAAQTHKHANASLAKKTATYQLNAHEERRR